jgi:hypothetical protein
MGKSIRNLTSVTRVGLDLAKRVFQVQAVDANGDLVVARKLTRGQLIPFFATLPPCGRCQSNGRSSVCDIATPDPSGYQAMSARHSPSAAERLCL